jgi:hypothetical protein
MPAVSPMLYSGTCNYLARIAGASVLSPPAIIKREPK